MKNSVYEKTIQPKPSARIECTMEINCWVIWLIDDAGAGILAWAPNPEDPTVKNKMIDVGLVFPLVFGSVKLCWETYNPLIMGDRELLKQFATTWDDFEYLYYELVKYAEEHPELAT